MPFRASFSCLWCGTPHTAAGEDDLEGWAQLCPACIGKAGEKKGEERQKFMSACLKGEDMTKKEATPKQAAQQD